MVNLDYLYNPAAAKGFFNENSFVNKKLGFQVIEHGTVLPHKDVMVNGVWTWGSGGIIDSKNEYVQNTNAHSGIGKAYTPPKESILHSSKTVIYLGLLYPAWGHFITDSIRRIWFLKSNEFKNQFKDCPVVYITWLGRELSSSSPNFKRFLEILEVDIDKFQLVKQPTQFENIILPDESFFIDDARKFTNEYCEAIDRVRHFALRNRTPISNKKIYFFHGRTQIGEERIAEYFKSKGYDIVSPEKLTLDEQLNIFINCESFASTLGSVVHNSLFLNDGTETIIIRRSQNLTNYQTVINQVRSLNVSYIDSTLSLFNYGASNNNFYLISEQLKRFFGDKWDGYDDEDFKNFLQYVKDSMLNGHAINEEAKKYYGKIFTDFMAQLKQHEDLITAANMPKNWEKFQPSLTYQTHIKNKSWGSWNGEEQISNDTDQMLDIQAIKINFPTYKVYYSVYWNDTEGWSDEVTNSEMAGTTGKDKAIFGIRIWLDEAGAKDFNILYRVHKFDGTWTDWAKNGEVIYSHGVKLNAIQIKLQVAK